MNATKKVVAELMFDEHEVIHQLKHYLPSQNPLKDFVHHNTLHAFQHLKFHEGIQQASETFGYQVYLPLQDFRRLYAEGRISAAVLDRVAVERKGQATLADWRHRLLEKDYDTTGAQRVGKLRPLWKEYYHVNMDKEVHPTLFRLLGAYLDQGVATHAFPVQADSFLGSVRALERHSFQGIFSSKQVKELLFDERVTISQLLKVLLWDERLFEQYLFDQQFAHPGWSGMASVLEDNPVSLLDQRPMSLSDLIFVELLLEIDVLTSKLDGAWEPLGRRFEGQLPPVISKPQERELFEVYRIWQEAYEWTYYDQVLLGMQQAAGKRQAPEAPSFQAIMCIDDRICSIRRYVEQGDPACQTFGTAGFFSVPFFFQPEQGKFYTKSCPAPMTPKYLVREREARLRHEKVSHFSDHAHGFFSGWLAAQTVGLWSAVQMVKNIFVPSESKFMVSSFRHMDAHGKLDFVCEHGDMQADGLQYGFTYEEMAQMAQTLLGSIGLVERFAPLVYVVGHGASSINNTHYAGYECGACSGRPGSVNARVTAQMLNMPQVRALLAEKGIMIPEQTRFLAALHDTTRDEIEYYDEEQLGGAHAALHTEKKRVFVRALEQNAKERARRFQLTDHKQDAEQVHKEVKKRSMSLFEPRPEWNHATNALCLVGRRENNKALFLDRRAFLNSYDYAIDPNGDYLLGILNAAAPVCGGINLEYYFSKVDNGRLGAGSKLPHNVMGLIGVANGMDGDLRTGLPKQMLDIHDPIRLMLTVEHFPEVVLDTIQRNPGTYEWFANEWVNLLVIHPIDKTLYRFQDGAFHAYEPLLDKLPVVRDVDAFIEESRENLPVSLID